MYWQDFWRSVASRWLCSAFAPWISRVRRLPRAWATSRGQCAMCFCLVATWTVALLLYPTWEAGRQRWWKVGLARDIPSRASVSVISFTRSLPGRPCGGAATARRSKKSATPLPPKEQMLSNGWCRPLAGLTSTFPPSNLRLSSRPNRFLNIY